MRKLELRYRGRAVASDTFATGIRIEIATFPESEIDHLRVWHVPGPDSPDDTAEDITEQFAMNWAAEIPLGDGIEPCDFLAPYPAFVRLHCADALEARHARTISMLDRGRVVVASGPERTEI